MAEADLVIVGECTPPGYDFINAPRGSSTYGGGIGILYKKSLNLTSTPTGLTSVTFEHCTVTINNSIKLICIYRPYPSRVNGFKTSEFLEEIDTFLEEICVTPQKVAVLGDFNVHMDEPDNYDTKKFNNSLTNTGLHQFVLEPTHIKAKPPPLVVTTTSREYGKVDQNKLTTLLEERLAEFPESEDPDVLVASYESITSSVLDEVCPLVTKTRTIKPRLPWYNDTIHQARNIRRRLERRWKKSRSEADETAFKDQKDHVCRLITNAKIDYFTNKCTNASVKEMYNTINVLLNKTHKVLPDFQDDLADEFLKFFIEKVEKIRNNVCSGSSCVRSDQDTATDNVDLSMCCFKPLTLEDVHNIIMKFPSKSCLLDTMPSWLVKDNLPTMLPVITQIVNASLTSGVFPSRLKHSIIKPVIKKNTMDPNSLKSYRPVANITFLSKVVEKAVTCQVTDYVDSNCLSEQHQSAYRRNHSTETALFKVKNDILQSLDKGNAVFMVLLDMSAAFDTVDHSILLHRLQTRFGMGGAVKSWFSTYLHNRTPIPGIASIMANTRKDIAPVAGQYLLECPTSPKEVKFTEDIPLQVQDINVKKVGPLGRKRWNLITSGGYGSGLRCEEWGGKSVKSPPFQPVDNKGKQLSGAKGSKRIKLKRLGKLHDKNSSDENSSGKSFKVN
ncbi:uncharacterized protein [Amphiura filiformis]|uniref:uncharacterized protein n=1 Tax=Amphiura filiformis TaxID=82378 RepID=UPI003B21D0F9